MTSLGGFLKYVRKKRELTQEQVAQNLNIVTPVLSKWENDKAVPPLDMLCRLCNLLDVSIEECINRELSDEKRELPPPDFEPTMLGKTLKELRGKNGWSQSDVGKRLFVASQTVSKWESGGINSLDILIKLAEIYGVSPSRLLNGLSGPLPPLKRAADSRKRPAKTHKRSKKPIIISVIIAVTAAVCAAAGIIWGIKSRDKKGETGDGAKESAFCAPVKEFYSVERAGLANGMYILGGMFFETAESAAVYAIADGTVLESDSHKNVSVTIGHADGLESEYYCVDCNLDVGSAVKRGDKIGNVAKRTTPQGEASFYIFMYLDGKKADPFTYITELPEPAERPAAFAPNGCFAAFLCSAPYKKHEI